MANIKPILLLNIKLLYLTYLNFVRDKVPNYGAAIAYYALFSIPPTILILISILGFWVAPQALEGTLSVSLEKLMGHDIATQIQNAVISVSNKQQNQLAVSFSTVSLFIIAAGMFNSIQDALHHIFGVYSQTPTDFFQNLFNRVISYSFLFLMGAMLIVTIFLNSALSFIGELAIRNISWLQHNLKLSFQFLSTCLEVINGNLTQLLNNGTSFLIIMGLFTLIYRLLPDVILKWNIALRGALLATSLFWIVKSIIHIYLSNLLMANAYGAAGSAILFMVWIYVTAQIFLLGAEYIKVLCLHYKIELVSHNYVGKLRAVIKKRNDRKNKI